MKMTGKRVLFVLSFILLIGLTLQQCWQSKSPAEKWLYFFKDTARDYSGIVLGAGRGTNVPVPEELSKTNIEVHERHVTFAPRQEPGLMLAFSPRGAPPADELRGGKWQAIGDGWYLLQ